MQGIAAEVGYGETAFLTSPLERGSDGLRLRYFAPDAEVEVLETAARIAGPASEIPRS